MAALHAAAERLRAAGATVQTDARPPFALAEAWDVAFRLWVAAASERTGDDEFERLAKLARAEGHPPEPPLAVRRAQAETMSHREWLRLDTQRRNVQRAWSAWFDDYDILICPVIPVVAPAHDPVDDLDVVASVDHRIARSIDVDGRPRPYLDQLTWNIVTGVAGLPATAVPIALNADRLPVGGQIVGPRYGDFTTIAVAGTIASPGVRRPAGF
jgi:amidase